jgi:hypothetical protein
VDRFGLDNIDDLGAVLGRGTFNHLMVLLIRLQRQSASVSVTLREQERDSNI